MGCGSSTALKEASTDSHAKNFPEVHSNESLSEQTHFSVDEVYALQELFNSVSNSLHKDGLIHKDEFAFALFKTKGQSNIFTDKVFQVFDTKQNDVIDFEEFVRALSVFHPHASLEEKASFAFGIYDLDNTDYIEPDEIKRFLAALLQDDSSIALGAEEIDSIVEKTMKEADLAGDGHISKDEWLALVRENPSIISYMTLPVLKEVTTKYPSFLFNESRP